MPTLTQHLTQLESHGLIRLATVQPELEYLFRHALIQDAAYASLVKADRKQLHLVVGEALERLYPDQLASRELAPVLAQHFYQAGDGERALRYFTLAGDAAARVYANAEAEMQYARALELATRGDAPISVTSEQLIHLYLSRGHALELTSQYPEAWRNYEDMEALARARGDRALELAALMARATLRSTPTAVHDPARGQALSEQALALARELGDRTAEAKILWNMMLLNSFTGQLRAAAGYGERALALARDLGLREQLAYTLNDIVRVYIGTGQFERAWAVVDEACGLWRELGNQPMLADNLGRSARILFAVGDYERALLLSEEARQISQAIGNLWGQSFCRMFVGYIYLERGEMARAIETMEECIRLGERAGFMMTQVGTRADLAWIYGTLGAIHRGVELAYLARAQAEQQLPGFRAWALACLARLHLMNGDLAEAEAAIKAGYATLNPEDFTTHGPVELPLADAELALAQQAFGHAVAVIEALVARLRKVGMRSFLADALHFKGKALLAQGRVEAARAAWMEARAEAEALGSRRVLWPVLAALAEIEAQLGNAAEAAALRRRAREIIQYIADHCPPDPSAGSGQSLRASFLHLPDVQAVVSHV
jgi:tetratricopeptide (TPR) repeat protein